MTKFDTRYRIYTEAIGTDSIVQKVSQFFQAFTVQFAEGYWNGKAERSIVIEILGTFYDNGSIRTIAEWIKVANGQEAVLVTRETVGGELI